MSNFEIIMTNHSTSAFTNNVLKSKNNAQKRWEHNNPEMETKDVSPIYLQNKIDYGITKSQH